MHDRRVEPGLGALVQVDAVERLARRGVEPEGDVGDPQDRAHPGQRGLDRADRLDRLDAVAARLLHAGRERQRQAVDEEVGRGEPVALDGEVDHAACHAGLPLRGAGLALLVDAGHDDPGAELRGQGEEAVEARALGVALFEVHRVEQRLAAEPGQRRARDRRLGRVDHDRHRRLRGQAAHQLVHVGDAVGAGVVDADVQDVRALFDLVAADGHAGVPVAREHGVAELLGPVGVGALADQQDRGVLAVRGRRVDRRRRRLELGVARRGRPGAPGPPRRRPGGPGSSRSSRRPRARRTR